MTVTFTFDAGALVQYEDNSVLFTAIVLGEKKGKVVVLNHRGREVELQKIRLHPLPGKPPKDVSDLSSKKIYLEKLVSDTESQLSTINPGEIWEFVAETPKEYSSSELTKLYFGDDTLSNHMLLRTALIRDRTFFKRDKMGFLPRPLHIVEDLKRAEEVRLKKMELETKLVSFLAAKLKDNSLPVPKEFNESIHKIEEVAAFVEYGDFNRHKESRDLVVLLTDKLNFGEGGSVEQKAFRLLERAGIFTYTTNLALIRHRVPIQFPEEVVKEAEKLKQKSLDYKHRKDLRDRYTVTVDDPSTKDMDDALSLVETDSGFEVGIHITDVADLIAPDSLLDQEAGSRGTSIYCPERVINMLPPDLSQGSLSLKAGEERACITALCYFDRNCKFVRSEVTPSIIKVTKRLSYDEVDALLEEHDRELNFLYDIAIHSEEARIEKGAQRVHKREAVPFVEQDGSIRLLEIDEGSPARLLVSELMVLANSQFANFAAEKKIPMLFRGQERPDEEPEDVQEEGEASKGPAHDFKARSKLKKSILSLEPVRHAGLALPAYIQATSPIRRYMDLVHQRQILWTFRNGAPWVDFKGMDKIVRELDEVLSDAQAVNKESRRYWLLKYLEQRGKKNSIKGTVVRVDKKNPLVELSEVYITVFVRTPKKVKPGDELELKITVIDPQSDYLRVECI